MSLPPTKASIHCPYCADIVEVMIADLIIDEIDQVYRVICSRCNLLLEKDLTLELDRVLRNVGALTVEQRVNAFRNLLSGDNDDALWHTMYDVAYKPETKDS